MTGLTLPFAMIPAAVDQRIVRPDAPLVVAHVRLGGADLRAVEHLDRLVDMERHSGGARGRDARLDDAQHDRLHVVPHRLEEGPKALAYTLLIAGWIATEYWYTVGEFSWPWLILGNGFSHDVWLVQWYEYTGVFGGSLWVLLCNILFFRGAAGTPQHRAVDPGRGRPAPSGRRVAEHLVELGAARRGDGRGEHPPTQRRLLRQIQRPRRRQEDNITDLLAQVPAGAQFILLPRLPSRGHYWEPESFEFPPGRRTGHVLARS